jgi:non-specific serine/threonine protein kinase
VLTLRIARNVWNSILRRVDVKRASKARINGLDEHNDSPRELMDALLENLEESLASRPVLRPLEESVFMRQGDYWTIRYQGQTAILKAMRGLDCLSYLLHRPERDVHVSELLATPIDLPAPALLGSLREAGGSAVTAGLQDAGPILDSQAKAEYKQRIDELRNDLEEAERFNDSYRAARARSEMDAIAEQLAVAVGLGGRDRRSSSKAERARSAVTKRIKEAINRIADVIPPLGCHLAARIKTGYFCSYNPRPDRPVAWKF